jgi:hypothetical protein
MFSQVKVNFLMKGHTHEDCDQLFSRYGVKLATNNMLSQLKASGPLKLLHTHFVSVEKMNFECILKWAHCQLIRKSEKCSKMLLSQTWITA